MTPDWFAEAVAHPTESHYLPMDGYQVHYRLWNSSSDKPGLLFVHGHAAHSHWWDFIAPAFLDRFKVAAIDMAGCGDSPHLPQYTTDSFTNEIAGVAATLGANTTVVGHSFGGSMSRIAAFKQPEAITALILVDSVISSEKGNRTPPPMPRIKERFYKDLETAKKRFRLRPPQPCANDYVLDYIATYSIRQTEQGYQFKFDPAVFAKMPPTPEALPDGVTMLRSITQPKSFIYGELSRFFPIGSESFLHELFADRVINIPDAHHHVFLDQPLAFINGLNKLL